MRIISKFHDYYDSAAGMGVDQDLVWVRKTEDFDEVILNDVIEFKGISRSGLLLFEDESDRLPGIFHTSFKTYGKDMEEFTAISRLVIVCGKAYVSNECYRSTKDSREYKYTIDDVENPVFQTYSFSKWKRYLKRFNKRKYSLYRDESNFVERIKAKNWLPIHQMAKSPILSFSSDLYKSGYLRYNTGNREKLSLRMRKDVSLKDFSFYKVMDSWTAFQELSMFMGSMAREGNPMEQLSDKERHAKHGFDKWSFRKLPEGKK